MFGISIATYRRSDGSTPQLLKRCIDSVLNQKAREWKIYLIGDNYTKEEEIKEIIQSIPKRKRFFCNIPVAPERDCDIRGMELWNCGGASALNFALSAQHVHDIEVHCHLDDDDWWEPNHLSVLKEAYKINPLVATVFTRARYCGQLLPHSPYEAVTTPIPCNTVHSSVSWRLKHIDSYYVPDKSKVLDVRMWQAFAHEVEKKELIGLYIPEVTVNKESEQSLLTRNEP